MSGIVTGLTIYWILYLIFITNNKLLIVRKSKIIIHLTYIVIWTYEIGLNISTIGKPFDNL